MTAQRMRQHLGCAVWHLREAIAEAPDSADLGDADGAVQQLATDPQGYFGIDEGYVSEAGRRDTHLLPDVDEEKDDEARR